jgi:4-diphosphocytidyl-2-C-methyl-D-erythritol kinase
MTYNRSTMGVLVRSFAKINLGLAIGPRREDGFHELRTIYQTIALHDVIRVEIQRGSGIEIRCQEDRVPRDQTNTCWRIAERTMSALKARGRVSISIDKKLPVQGGLGGASGNAVSVMLALERALGKALKPHEKLRIAGEVGSDLPLFLVGGTVLGDGRGEEVYPLEELPASICVIAMPDSGVSTPEAFRDWDQLRALTPNHSSGRINQFANRLSGWLNTMSQFNAGAALSGVPGGIGGGRAGNPLLDLVRTGIENDFEQVVFPKYPELREVKRVLAEAGAFYASLSGSGSALYGLFASLVKANRAVAKLRKMGTAAVLTRTLRRQQYWKKWLVRDF